MATGVQHKHVNTTAWKQRINSDKITYKPYRDSSFFFTVINDLDLSKTSTETFQHQLPILYISLLKKGISVFVCLCSDYVNNRALLS